MYKAKHMEWKGVLKLSSHICAYWPKVSCSQLNVILFEQVRVFDRVKLVAKSSTTHPFTMYNQSKYEFHQLRCECAERLPILLLNFVMQHKVWQMKIKINSQGVTKTCNKSRKSQKYLQQAAQCSIVMLMLDALC